MQRATVYIDSWFVYKKNNIFFLYLHVALPDLLATVRTYHCSVDTLINSVLFKVSSFQSLITRSALYVTILTNIFMYLVE